ncbi:MAG: septal ring lytic transglycosylase RlpA family protein [Candidatus Omnitrophota bacterium]|jgi:rare lipoprotein A (peptidoglycan hydrolase)
MTILIPRSATSLVWPCVLALASVLAFALGWSMGVDNGRSWAAREIEPEIQANRDAMSAISDRLIYLEEWSLFRTLASHYGGRHNGRLTASGAVFDENEFTAASPWIEFGKKIRVTNIANGRSVVVRVTDRGPHPRLGRGLDLSTAAAREIGLLRPGVAPVQIGPAW